MTPKTAKRTVAAATTATMTTRKTNVHSHEDASSDTEEVSKHDPHDHQQHPHRHNSKLHNGGMVMRLGRGSSLDSGTGGGFDIVPPTGNAMDYGHRLNGTTDTVRQDPVATNWTSPASPPSEVSADPCCDLVRYEPPMEEEEKGEDEEILTHKKKLMAKKVSQVYMNWNLHKDIIVRPPIVFNGTFPIDKPISSRFFEAIPETIDEEGESSGTEESIDTDTSSSEDNDGVLVNRRLRGLRARTVYSKRRPIDYGLLNKVRLRRRIRPREL